MRIVGISCGWLSWYVSPWELVLQVADQLLCNGL